MPNRTIRDFTDSEKVNGLSWKAECFFVRLMMKADDFGSFHANAKLLKANLFPHKVDDISDEEITEWKNECEKANLIVLYTANKKQYLRILEFGQRLRNMRNKFPEPEEKKPSNEPENSNPQQLAATCSEQPPEDEVEGKKNPKMKTKENGITSPTKHEDFLIEFLKDEGMIDAVKIQTRVDPEIEILKKFNAHCKIEHKNHLKYSEWCSHLRSWINRNKGSTGNEVKKGQFKKEKSTL